MTYRHYFTYIYQSDNSKTKDRTHYNFLILRFFSADRSHLPFLLYQIMSLQWNCGFKCLRTPVFVKFNSKTEENIWALPWIWCECISAQGHLLTLPMSPSLRVPVPHSTPFLILILFPPPATIPHPAAPANARFIPVRPSVRPCSLIRSLQAHKIVHLSTLIAAACWASFCLPTSYLNCCSFLPQFTFIFSYRPRRRRYFSSPALFW